MNATPSFRPVPCKGGGGKLLWRGSMREPNNWASTQAKLMQWDGLAPSRRSGHIKPWLENKAAICG